MVQAISTRSPAPLPPPLASPLEKLQVADLQSSVGAAAQTSQRLLRIRDGQGQGIRCVGRQAWITQENDGRDIFVAAGESFILDRPGLALVSAFSESAIVVVKSAATQAGDDPKLAVSRMVRLRADLTTS
jgi:Protein of unknown function (DUF2917)